MTPSTLAGVDLSRAAISTAARRSKSWTGLRAALGIDQAGLVQALLRHRVKPSAVEALFLPSAPRVPALDPAPWESADVLADLADRFTVTGIAGVLGSSPREVRNALRAAGLPVCEQIPPVQQREIAAKYAAGATADALAAELGITSKTIRRVLRGLDVSPRHRGPAPGTIPRRPLPPPANVNRARSAAAAERAVATARLALETLDVPDRWLTVLTARVEHPTSTLAEVGAALGWTKDKYSSALRDALRWAQDAQARRAA